MHPDRRTTDPHLLTTGRRIAAHGHLPPLFWAIINLSAARWNQKQATMAVEAYCVKCKAKREMKDPKENTMANGRKAMKGTCPKCGTGMFKIMGNK